MFFHPRSDDEDEENDDCDGDEDFEDDCEVVGFGDCNRPDLPAVVAEKHNSVIGNGDFAAREIDDFDDFVCRLFAVAVEDTVEIPLSAVAFNGRSRVNSKPAAEGNHGRAGVFHLRELFGDFHIQPVQHEKSLC